jgi:Amt family ammonium transporter
LRWSEANDGRRETDSSLKVEREIERVKEDQAMLQGPQGSARRNGRLYRFVAAIVLLLGHSQLLVAQSPSSTAAFDERNGVGFSGGSESQTLLWLVASCLGLLAALPGMLLYYGGQVRRKNVVHMMAQLTTLVALMGLIWALIGYSLTFADSGRWNSWVGGLQHVGLSGVQPVGDSATGFVRWPMALATPQIPTMVHLLVHGILFSLASAILCGAYAERMRFSGMLWVTIAWGLLVYCPVAHWVWGSGNPTTGATGRGMDLSGGWVVHALVGIASLVVAIYLGPRLGHRREPMPPHNLTYTAIGAGLIWVGLMGMHAACSGSSIDRHLMQSIVALVSTYLAAAAGALAWGLVEWWDRGRPSLMGTASGLLAGLAAIASGAGVVQPLVAIGLGGCAGCLCYLACSRLKNRIHYDDALDVFGIHGVGGILGGLAVGLFASPVLVTPGHPEWIGWWWGGTLLTSQWILLAWVIAYDTAMTLAILKIVDMACGLRVSVEQERQGLDLAQHGEEGYIW